jgi:hypothetical protein
VISVGLYELAECVDGAAFFVLFPEEVGFLQKGAASGCAAFVGLDDDIKVLHGLCGSEGFACLYFGAMTEVACDTVNTEEDDDGDEEKEEFLEVVFEKLFPGWEGWGGGDGCSVGHEWAAVGDNEMRNQAPTFARASSARAVER